MAQKMKLEALLAQISKKAALGKQRLNPFQGCILDITISVRLTTIALSYRILLGYPRFSRANNRLPLRFDLLGIGVM